MQGQDSDNELFCVIGNCENIALYGRYCKHHIVNALADAEARAVQLEQERNNALAERDMLRVQLDFEMAHSQRMMEERDRANAGFKAVKDEYDRAMTRLAAHGEKVTA